MGCAWHFGGLLADLRRFWGGFEGLLEALMGDREGVGEGVRGGVRRLRRCSITIFGVFLDFSIVLFLLGSWFFRNIAGEYFWTFLPVGFRMKVISCWSLG